MTGETDATRRKRLYMRSIRRGIKEMDLLLKAFADARLGTLDAGTLDLYERLLAENDQDLYAWVSGQVVAPDAYGPLLDQIRETSQGLDWMSAGS